MTAKSAKGLCRLVMLAVLLAMPWTAGWASNTITACDTYIDTSGTYTLANDLSCPGDGIVIVADNVTLNLNGHRITGSGSDFGIRVQGGSDATITGPGTISNFDVGVGSGSPRGEVSKVTSTGNNIGFELASQGHDLLKIHDCIATHNHEAGFQVHGSFNELVRNQSNENVNGFELIEGAGRNILRGNTAEENGNIGIWAQSGAEENDISDNTANYNETYDLADDNPGCRNVWRHNDFDTRNQDCIQ